MTRLDLDQSPPIVLLTNYLAEILRISPILSRQDQETVMRWLHAAKFDLHLVVAMIERLNEEFEAKGTKLTINKIDKKLAKLLAGNSPSSSGGVTHV